jgi:7-cyano-7-deazaguanine tRNA-ribosyltransferase
MGIRFESFHSDIAARCGRLTAGNRSIKTPALLPVINPHLQLITPAEMAKMGVEALITNAYIFWQSDQYREKVVEQGLHALLGFDGLIMTDSGSFQLSEYGDITISNTETLSYQRDIKSDIWVPLDIPTPPSADRPTAERELAMTLDRLREAKEMFGDDAPVAGPVQGGIYKDLRERAGREVREMGFLFCPIGAVVPLMESYRYRELLHVVMAAKRTLSPAACIHLFGAGHPLMFAFAAALGCDLFDSAAYALYAKEGRYLTSAGSMRLDELAELPCPCRVCRSHTAEEILKSEEKERLLALHNLYATLAEVARVRQAITDGTLFELVDERCRSHPRLLSAYKEMLDHPGQFEPHDRITKRRFFYRGTESCKRTEIIRYQDRLSRLRLGRDVLILLDRRAGGEFDDVLLFRPPFGPFPRELSETFPLGQSGIPDWDDPMVRSGCSGIRRLIRTHPGTRFVIACRATWVPVIREEVPKVEVWCDQD